MFGSKLQTQNENKVNFKKKTYAELQELYERQRKILSNGRFVEGLPDKGEKLKQFIAQLEIELNKRDVHKKLCTDMLALNIGSDQLDTFEWTGKHVTAVHKNSQPDVIGDDEVLKMFVSHSGVNQDKIIIEEKPEKALIKPSDLIEEDLLEGKQKDYDAIGFSENMERYAKNLCGRIDTHLPTERKHFLLNKPAVPNKHTIVKSADVSLKESVMLQVTYDSKLKELKAESLKQKPIPKFDTSNYRNTSLVNYDNILEDESDEDNDILDIDSDA
ncbi:uncharacterized protein LOC100169253 [Acyrthosiphon pisum]|uniref:ACYPI009888 protein n=1 Tax=Acyrthosiphon pisum TaxID=7029 RepID=C4WY02_ACYPI|nr:uncharacterized protein LOC100169253 [Acyrthosiphon pisum]BAH72772.1 ACYPI009888 [Acyrthosiphon pisum]|eukprot:NP_001155819.1 uncharacterized protein LOC100169253 [Acyrthosiphon pisum]